MKPLGLNRGGYLGDCIDPDRVMACIRDEAARDGWTVEALETEAGVTLPVLRRHARRPGHRPLRCYLSAGIHGDEIAGETLCVDLAIGADPAGGAAFDVDGCAAAVRVERRL